MTSYRNKQDNNNLIKNFEELKNSMIGTIEIGINKSNFDNYKRNYQRLQSLLAEIMSVSSLLFEIGIQISNILGDKKMSIDIMDYILNKNLIDRFKNHNAIKLFGRKIKKEESTNRKINLQIIENSNNKDDLAQVDESKINKSDNNMIKNIGEIEENNIILKKINYFHILKSFFCFKDKRSELINYYHNIISNNMSVEKMLERFYILDNINNNLTHEKKEKKLIKKIKSFKEKDKNGYIISKEIKKENNLYDNKNDN